MFLLVPAHSGCPGHPESCKTVVRACVCVYCQLNLLFWIGNNIGNDIKLLNYNNNYWKRTLIKITIYECKQTTWDMLT